MMTRICGPASAALLLLFATPVVAQRSDHRVLDRAAIARAGWHRLGDLVGALPPGSTASVEGFNNELRGSRVGFLQTNGVTASWIVRLDGQPVPLQVGGIWVLDEIPVVLAQLDSIVIAEGPQLSEGRAALMGTIDLFTRRPREATIVGDYQHGDETGDPGPYRYTARATPNVEKIGPFASGAAAIGNGMGALDGAGRYAALNITDSRLTQRIGPIFPAYQSDVNASGGSGVATLDLLGGRTFVIAGRGRFTGFFPTAAAGVNQQLRIVASHAGVSGSVSALRRVWRYAVTGTSLDLDPIGNIAMVTPDSRRVFSDGLIEGEVTDGVLLGAGGTVGRRESTAERQRLASARVWAKYAGPNDGLDFSVDRSAGKFRYSGSAHLDRAVNDSDHVALTLTRLEAWRYGDFAWMDRAAFDSSGTTALDVRADLVTTPILRVRPTWYARGFSYSGIGVSPVRGIAGGVVAETMLVTAVRARLRAEITQLLGAAGTGESSTPGGYVEGDLSTRTSGGFQLALAGRYAPRTHWSGSIDDVPSTRRIDCSVNKSIWDDRIRAQLVMRNLLNAAERTHPEGAQWNLRTQLAVTVALPSGAGR
jgi:hypothetical protein